MRRQVEAERPARHAALSKEAREAFAHFITLRDRDLAAAGADARTRRMMEVEATHFDPPAPQALPAPKRAAEEDNWHPPKGYSYGKPKPLREPKTAWTLKDDSFDP